MILKIPVIDRAPTFPGRVILAPVQGQTNTYDMVRADAPTQPGTPLNKALLDNKAYTLLESVTVYVNGSTGNNSTADGTSTLPFKTIQAAIDALPKCLGGFVATVDIAAGTYSERVRIEGFYGGRLIVGNSANTVTVNGISIFASTSVELRISTVTAATGNTDTLLYVGAGSEVLIGRHITLNCASTAAIGVGVEQNSSVSALGTSVNVNNSTDSGIKATQGGRIHLSIAGGNNNTGVGLRADNGGVITYATRSLAATTVTLTANGGKIYTGAQTSIPNY